MDKDQPPTLARTHRVDADCTESAASIESRESAFVKRKRDDTTLSRAPSIESTKREYLVYSFGDNTQNQLMFVSQPGTSITPSPTRIIKLSAAPVLCLACAEATSFVVSDVGGIWGGGSNNGGLISLATDNDELETLTCVSRPHQLDKFADKSVTWIAAGAEHCVVVFENGGVLSFGTNEFGQLGHGPNTESLKRCPPKPVYKVSGFMPVCQAACGRNFTMLLTKSGELYTCGDNSNGCLGIPGLDSSPTAEKVPRVTALPIVTIAAGASHCMALTLSGKLYVWGRCKQGQLGLGETLAQSEKFVSEPILVEIPSPLGTVKAIAAGGEHSVLMMSRGAVLCAGENVSGQCGIDPVRKQHLFEFERAVGFPSECRWLMGSAGQSHTVLVSTAGEVWSFGRNLEGQLGIGSPSAYESVPQRVQLPQINMTCFSYGCAAGSFYTLIAAVPLMLDPEIIASAVRKQSLASDGDNLAPKDLASRSLQDLMPSLPLFRVDSDVRPLKSAKKITYNNERLESIFRSASIAGDEQPKLWRLPSVEVRVLKRATPARAVDTEMYHAGLSAKEFLNLIEAARNTEISYRELVRVLTMVFSSATRLNCSFLLKWRDPILDVEGLESVYSGIESLGEERSRDIWTKLVMAMKTCVTDCQAAAPMMKDNDQIRWILICLHCPVFGTGTLSQEVGSTLMSILNCVPLLPCVSRQMLMETLANHYSSSLFKTRIVDPVRNQVAWVLQRSIGKPILDVDDLWAVMMVLQICYLANEKVAGETRIEECFKRFKKIPEDELSIIIPPNARINPEAELAVFENWIRAIRAATQSANVIDVPLHTIPHTPSNADAAELTTATTQPIPTNPVEMQHLQDQVQNQSSNIQTVTVSADEFPTLFKGPVKETEKVAAAWKYDPSRTITEDGPIKKTHRFFLSHCNLLPMTFKRDVFMRDAIKKQVLTTRQLVAIAIAIGQNVIEPFFVLTVDRNNLVSDTFKQLTTKEEQWMRPLKVSFREEEGVDEGGLKREFFRLITRELISTKYQLFDHTEDMTSFWFVLNHQPDQLEDYRLLGTLIGMATYNNVQIPLNFPPCLYKKLLNEPVDLSDFETLDPVKAKSFREMLEMPVTNEEQEADFDAIYGFIDFTYQINNFGEMEAVELMEGGKDVCVTKDNRQRFVDLTVDFVLNTQIKDSFEALRAGIERFFSTDLLSVINSKELELLITGTQTLDFEELKAGTRYGDGYTEDSPYIKEFWERIMKWDENTKRKFLLFCTGTDRSPLGGLQELRFTIQQNGSEPTNRLPTSHTCFNLLLLPKYSDADKMEMMLKVAIEGCEGFGLR